MSYPGTKCILNLSLGRPRPGRAGRAGPCWPCRPGWPVGPGQAGRAGRTNDSHNIWDQLGPWHLDSIVPVSFGSINLSKKEVLLIRVVTLRLIDRLHYLDPPSSPSSRAWSLGSQAVLPAKLNEPQLK